MDEAKIEIPEGCEGCPSLLDGTCKPGEGISTPLKTMMGGRGREDPDPSVTRPILELPGGILVPGSITDVWGDGTMDKLRDMIASDLGITPLKAHEVTHSDWLDWAPKAKHITMPDKDNWNWSVFPIDDAFRETIISTIDFFL